MEQTDATSLINACFHDASAPCSRSCPFGLDLRSFLKKCARGRWPAAYRELRTAVVFPTVAAKLCPEGCMEKCQRMLIGDEAISISALEKAVLRYAGEQAPDAFPLPEKDTPVAVIGAGPAGLSLALQMARKKYPVTVFEKSGTWGGSLRTHPDFAEFDADFRLQFSLEKVDFRFSSSVDVLNALDDFAAVYIASGRNGTDLGLRAEWDPETMQCGNTKFFLGGEACGMSVTEGVAVGALVSRGMESFIQTGKVFRSDTAAPCGDCRLVPEDAVSAARVVPASVDGYTKDEAKAEAARCFQCNCSACMNKCELLAAYRKAPMQMAMEVFADSGPHFLASRTMTRQSYSCNQCGYCKSICPGGVDMGELFRLSREARTAENIQPAALHEFWLEELDFTCGEGFYASREKHEYLFFPGCQLTELHPNQVLDTWRFLRENLDIGVILGCCGAPAVWAGDTQRRESNISKLKEVWSGMGRPKIITACASCGKMLEKFAPEMETVSLYEILSGLDTPTAALPFSDAAVFDPCAAREDKNAHDGVLRLTEKSGCRAEALADGGKCCGYGGHIRLANPELYKKITDSRASESSKPYVVYCANCLEVFRAKGKECAHVLDAVFGDRDERSPTLSQKRKNILYVKDTLMKETDGAAYRPSAHPWDDVSLEISREIRRDMEDALILDEDLQELIWNAEQTQDYFADESGLRCASLIRPVIVYWAEYRLLESGKYEIVSAYCHRMHFGEAEKA